MTELTIYGRGGQGGVTLFPGEEALYEGADWAKIEGGVLTCGGHCPRAARLMCSRTVICGKMP